MWLTGYVDLCNYDSYDFICLKPLVLLVTFVTLHLLYVWFNQILQRSDVAAAGGDVDKEEGMPDYDDHTKQLIEGTKYYSIVLRFSA